jgi:hypothetical protein
MKAERLTPREGEVMKFYYVSDFWRACFGKDSALNYFGQVVFSPLLATSCLFALMVYILVNIISKVMVLFSKVMDYCFLRK